MHLSKKHRRKYSAIHLPICSGSQKLKFSRKRLAKTLAKSKREAKLEKQAIEVKDDQASVGQARKSEDEKKVECN
ncbi:MAG: hypothetical protein UU47_C0003G0071 [candidate division TM6 bacterium GW2011_GWE2_41_16]|nr:MAG: hypothetical protein UU47_C0003G0071 [candidate division TM6 bacterium GW2011_GWE2_41_16]